MNNPPPFIHNNLPPAARRNYLARYVFDNEIIGTRPHMIRVRPIRQAGTNYDDQRILAQFAEVMIREIRRLLRIHLPTWTNAQFNQRVHGRLMMTNWHNEGDANVEDINLTGLTGDTFNRMFAEARTVGSNPELSIYDVTWTYFIVPNSLILGGSFGKFTNPQKLKGIKYWDQKLIASGNITHEDIGCGTLAIALGMDSLNKNPKFVANKNTTRFASKLFTDYCHQLKLELELGKICTVQDLNVFPLLYPDWRLVVIFSGFTKPTIFIGENYSRDSNHKKDKSVFIYHDLKTSHFIHVSGLTVLYKSLPKGFPTICYECCTSYNPSAVIGTCLCGEKQGKARVHKSVVCECGAKYQKGQPHRCGESKCITCQLFYKGSKATNDKHLDKLHRCPCYIKPASIEKVFKGFSN